MPSQFATARPPAPPSDAQPRRGRGVATDAGDVAHDRQHRLNRADDFQPRNGYSRTTLGK
jgi:hypothetical protein